MCGDFRDSPLLGFVAIDHVVSSSSRPHAHLAGLHGANLLEVPRCVLRAVAWRADEGGDDALPAGIRAALAKEARGWRDAPRDLEEIRAMQAGEVGVWA